MEFLREFGLLPKDPEVLVKIDQAAIRLCRKLTSLDVDSLNISDYNKKYLSGPLRDLHSSLPRYASILAWSLAYASIPLDDFVFVDYGGGSGLLALLAKESGTGSVVYNDIYDISCRDARTIAKAVGNEAEHYVQGELDQLISFMRKNSISCNGIASNDVIEHVYDVDGDLRKLRDLSEGPMTVAMATGANILNPLIRRALTRQQLQAEHVNKEKTWGHKDRDSLRAYVEIRREIISSYSPMLTEAEIRQLAEVTRGMKVDDIKNAVDTYRSTGEWPRALSHPTNTCDPITGNWTEHLMDPYHLRDILAEEGFAAQIISGLYGSPRSATKRFLAFTLNFLIATLQTNGIRLAPFIVLYGRKPKTRSGGATQNERPSK